MVDRDKLSDKVDFDKYRQKFKNKLASVSGWTSSDEDDWTGVDQGGSVTVLELRHDNKQDVVISCNVYPKTEKVEFLLNDQGEQTGFYSLEEVKEEMETYK